MLAQNFKSAADLGISEPQLSALQKVLVLLETGKLVHERSRADESFDVNARYGGFFNMELWSAKHPCGTVACIGGTAELVGNVSFGAWVVEAPAELRNLFSPLGVITKWAHITPSQAATALRSYLTIGDARWDLAVASPAGEEG